ncbi:MAG: adenylate/guanylate cyclase domain-containing protein [Verrucomicrobiota bacterium]
MKFDKLPLRVILSLTFILLIIVSTVSILVISVVTSRKTIHGLGFQIMEQQNDAVRSKVEQYFSPTIPVLHYVHEAIIQDDLELKNWENHARRLVPLLDAVPSISWIYYTHAESGATMGATRVFGKKGVYYSANVNSPQLTYEILPNGELSSFRFPDFNYDNQYDPRTRPWYQLAVESSDAMWTRPYSFNASGSNNITGVTASWAFRNDEGEILGVFAADILMSELEIFLKELSKMTGGYVILADQDGEPLFEMSKKEQDVFLGLKENIESNQMKFEGLVAGETVEVIYGGFFTTTLGAARRLTAEGIPDYALITLLPGADIFSLARENMVLYLSAAGVLILFSIFSGLYLANRLANPLTDLSAEMTRISDFNISSDPSGPSFIYEFSVVTGALDKMKASLRTFSRYVPRDLVRAALASGLESEVGGKTCHLSIMFADIAGFTNISESLAPKEVFAELSQCLEILTQVPEQNGGVMLTFLGDGVLAAFNAPNQLRDHAAQAVHSALEIRDQIKALNEKRMHAGDIPFHVRIGINTADVLVGNVGIPDRFSYSVLGDGANLSSRLENLNKFYGTEILVSQSTFTEGGINFEWKLIDQIIVKGRTRPALIYTPLGLQGQLSEEVSRSRDLYHQAFAYYQSRSFQEAIPLFEQSAIHSIAPRSEEVMIQRCLDYIKTPPEEGWTGSFIAYFK